MFASSPPNAVLVEHAPQGDADAVALTLFDPRVMDGSVTFRVEIISDERRNASTHLVQGFHEAAPASYGQVSLFIDEDYTPLDCSTLDCSTPSGFLGL